MRSLILAAMLAATPAAAKQSVLSCFSEKNQQHLTIVGTGTEDVKIQWDGGPFNFGTAAFEDDRYLVVKQFGNKGTFRMVYDATTGAAYGGTIFYNGKKWESSFVCVWQ